MAGLEAIEFVDLDVDEIYGYMSLFESVFDLTDRLSLLGENLLSGRTPVDFRLAKKSGGTRLALGYLCMFIPAKLE